MIRLNFHGALQVDMGLKTMIADVSDCREALKLMEVNCPGVINKWFRRAKFLIVVNGEPITEKTSGRKLRKGDVVDFVPQVAGSGFWLVAAIVVAVISLAVSIVSIFTRPKFDNASENALQVQRESNVSAEGVMVPLGYGECRSMPPVASSDRIAGVNQATVPYSASRPWLTDENDITLGDGSQPSQGYISSEDVTTTKLFMIGEGPVQAVLSNGRKSIFIDGTQLEAADGSQNFDDVYVDIRDGSDPQDPINMIERAATPVNIDTELTTDWYTRTLSAGLDAFRVSLIAPALIDKSGNKEKAVRIRVIVERSPTGAGTWTQIGNDIIEDKTLVEKLYQKTYDLDSSVQYDVRIKRNAEPRVNTVRQDKITLDSITEIIRDRVTYDGTALLAIKAKNRDLKKVEVISKHRIVKVPSNYNTTTRAYTGTWDGTFVDGFSDNPFYVALDPIENTRYSIGGYGIEYDKFDIYALGQYSDELVDDGAGGTEPRFTFNGVFTSRKKVMQRIGEILQVARAQFSWTGSKLTFDTERDKTPLFIANNANVRQGTFSYRGRSRDAKKNRVTVKYRDKTNAYLESFVTYTDHEAVRKYGLRPTEIDGVAITSPGQAWRHGAYSVLTDGRVVSFEGSPEFADAVPGDLIEVYDQHWAQVRLGGRCLAATTTTVTLDQTYTLVGGDLIACMLPDGTREQKTIDSVATVTASGKTVTRVTIVGAFTIAPQTHAVWGITNSSISPQLYTIQRRERASGGDGYDIDAVLYDPDKITFIETGVKVDSNETTTLPKTFFVSRPIGLTFHESVFQDNIGFRRDLNITWSASSSSSEVVTGYDIYYQFEGGLRRTLEIDSDDTTSVLRNAVSGRYDFYVYARTVNAISEPALATYTVTDDSPAESVTVTGLELFGQGNDTEFRNRDAKFSWLYNSPYQEEVEYAQGTVIRDAVFKDFVISIYDGTTLVRQEEGIQALEYTYTLEKNLEDQVAITGSATADALRSFRIEVQYRDVFNFVSDAAKLSVSNPAPAKPETYEITGTVGGFTLLAVPPANLIDWAGMRVHASTSTGFTPSDLNLVADTTQTSVYLDRTIGTTYFVRFAYYDTFGKTGLNYSDEFEVTAKTRIDTSPPPTPTNLALSSSVTTAITGMQIVSLMATADRNSDTSTQGSTSFYEFAIEQGSGSPVTYGSPVSNMVPQPDTGTDPALEIPVLPNTPFRARVRAIDEYRNASSWTDYEIITSAGDSTAPAAPTGLSVVATARGLELSWTPAEDYDLAYTQIWQNTVNNASTATRLAISSGNTYVITGLAGGTTYYFWLSSIDTSGNESAKTASQSATTLGLTKSVYAEISTEQTMTVAGTPGYQEVTGLTISSHTTSSDDILTITGVVAGSFGVATANKFAMDIRIYRGTTVLKTIGDVFGKGDVDVNNAPQPMYFNVPIFAVVDGNDASSDYSIHVRIGSNYNSDYDAPSRWSITYGHLQIKSSAKG